MGIHFNPANANIGPMMDVASKKMALAKGVNNIGGVEAGAGLDSTTFSNKAYFNSYDSSSLFALAGVTPPKADVQARAASFVGSITSADVPMDCVGIAGAISCFGPM